MTNPQVIEAAERAHGEVRYWRVKDKGVKVDGTPSMERAIRAADAARAPMIIAAVDALLYEAGEQAMYANDPVWGGICDPDVDKIIGKRRELLALFGIEES